MKNIILTLVIIFFSACNDGEVFVQDKEILNTKIECMRLVVFPPNDMIESTLKKLYRFKKDCNYSMIISYKSGIVCNSNQNSDKKVKGLPKSYLRMEIKKGFKLSYTYYKDLTDNLQADDIEDGFKTIESDLDLRGI